MNEVIAKRDSAATPGSSAPIRGGDYTGILPSQRIREMLSAGEIKGPVLTKIDDDQIQPASIDLRLGAYAYPVDTSFLPGKGMRVLEKLKLLDHRYADFKIDLSQGAVLEKGRVYVIPLLESIHLRSDVAAFANPKSSTGRLDILTRLIADEATSFDQVTEGYKGELFLEAVSILRTGSALLPLLVYGEILAGSSGCRFLPPR